MFGKLGDGTGYDILTVVVMSVIIILPTIIWKKYTRDREIKMTKNNVIITIVLIILWIGICTFGVITLRGVCMC
jgi:hypothetical protein